jgi:hypothetical protein
MERLFQAFFPERRLEEQPLGVASYPLAIFIYDRDGKEFIGHANCIFEGPDYECSEMFASILSGNMPKLAATHPRLPANTLAARRMLTVDYPAPRTASYVCMMCMKWQCIDIKRVYLGRVCRACREKVAAEIDVCVRAMLFIRALDIPQDMKKKIILRLA